MATLTLKSPDGTRRSFPLRKRLTSVGGGEDDDIRLSGATSPVPPNALHLRVTEKGHALMPHEGGVELNGLAAGPAELAPGDVLRLAGFELVYANAAEGEAESAARGSADGTGEAAGAGPRGDPGPTAPTQGESSSGGRAAAIETLRRLTSFSTALLGAHRLDDMLEHLLDEAIALTSADKGLLILVNEGDPRVHVARHAGGRPLDNPIDRISDTILGKVLETREPLLVSDALSDPELSASQSVVSLQLLSVACVPVKLRGELFGVLYLGNDRLARRFGEDTLDLLTIFAAHASLLLQNALLVDELRLDNRNLRDALEARRFGDLVGACASMRDVYRRVEKVAPTDISVLITGETGTGKELIAREIHRRSPRADGPFVVLNCGALPEALLESELFGHVRGAFTGAVSTRPGRFQAANGGTLFLDELGEMPASLQVKLLRALQEKVVHKVGDHKGDKVDIRVLAATNRILEDEVQAGRFREDLYYRIKVVELRLPPLREREEDLPVLARYLLQRHTEGLGSPAKGFSQAALTALRRHTWPGNVRELDNRLQKAAVLADNALLTPEDLDLGPERQAPIVPLAEAKDDFQRRYINEVLERNGGNRTRTARDLGVDPRTIFRHLVKEAERLGAPPPSEEAS